MLMLIIIWWIHQVGRIGTDEVINLEKHKMTDIQQHTSPFPESIPIISHKFFSSNTILWSPNLEYLGFLTADSLDVVFDLEGLEVDEDHQRIVVLAQLKTLEVKNLSSKIFIPNFYCKTAFGTSKHWDIWMWCNRKHCSKRWRRRGNGYHPIP